MAWTISGSSGTISLGFTGVGKRGESLLGLRVEMDDVAIPASATFRNAGSTRLSARSQTWPAGPDPVLRP